MNTRTFNIIRLNGKWLLPILLISLISTNGCKKFITVDAPINSTNVGNVFTDNAIAASVLTGIYTNLSNGNSGGGFGGDFTGLSLIAGMSADEITLNDLNNQAYFLYYSNSLLGNSGNIGIANYWTLTYPYIFTVNSAIEGLTNSVSLTPTVKNQLLGEAKFMRAFFYFYLVNLYGDVPLCLSSDWKINAALSRTPASQVYLQIISDLKDAQKLLSSDYLDADALTKSTARVRPSKWVATALLARVYLYTNNDFANAETEATKIIDNPFFQLVPLNSVFLKNSAEAIWQLQATGTGPNSNTGEGKLFILPAGGPNSGQPVYLSNYVVNSFEAGDQRKTNWTASVTVGATTYNYPNKYKIGAVNTTAQEYCIVFRLAEPYLIRAEARAQQNNISGAQADLNAIRTRAALPNTTANDKPSLLTAIMQERKVELFTEWGHRWFDLKRTNTIDAVMETVTPTKNGTWQTTDKLYPIPQSELDKSKQLLQNEGY